MSAMSNYFKEAVLKSTLNAVAFPSLPSVWLGLALTNPFTDGDYSSEVVGNGYARIQLTAAFTVVEVAPDQWQGSNTDGLAYLEATAHWGSPPTDKVVGIGLFDANVVGNLITHELADEAIPVYAGTVIYIDPATLIVEAQ